MARQEGYESRMNGQRVLVIDDDEDIRTLVVELLQRAGLDVDQAGDGRSGLRAFHQSPPDLVVLDVSMPDLDGWQTLERIRDLSDVPVMMVTARGAELERVRGLQAGADDYLVKPFGRQELVARVHALLRRARPGGDDREESYADDRITIDFAQRSVSYDGREVTLTPLEFKLLAAFVRHPRQVLSRAQVLELVWGNAYGVSGDQVKLYVGYLRRKLDPEQPDRVPIETVRGFGYRYQAPR
jgi:DNA-binding response OmpR family regulator